MTVLVTVLLMLLPTVASAKTVTGRIEAYVVESDGVPHAPAYGVRRSARRAPVRITNPDDRLIVGATMRVRGTLDAGRTSVTMQADAKGATLLRAANPPLPLGVTPLAVIHLAFPDAPRTRALAPVLATQHDLAAWYADASHGQWTFAPVAVSAASAERLADIECDFTPLATAGIRAADDQLDYRTTPLVNVVMPATTTACAVTRNGAATIGPQLFQTDDGKVMLGVQITREDWGPSVHELGHALGLTHAMRLACPQPGLPNDVRGCLADEYGDPFDPMGTGWGSTFQAHHQVQLGWLPRPPLVTAPGFFVLSPVSAASGLRALRFASRGRQVWVEARGLVGVDAYSVSAARPDFQRTHVHAELAPAVLANRTVWPDDLALIERAPDRYGLDVGESVTLDQLRVFVQYRNADGTTGLSVSAAPTATPQPTPTPTVFDGCCSTEPFCPGPSGWYCYRYDPGDPESGGGGGCWRDAACP